MREIFISRIGMFVRREGETTAALIVDSYKAHITETTFKVAAEIGLQLIVVPKKTTAIAQPLDISCMGPFKRSRQIKWVEQRERRGEGADTLAAAVERTVYAYERINTKTIQAGWKPVLGTK